jgi:hypothetical protein
MTRRAAFVAAVLGFELGRTATARADAVPPPSVRCAPNERAQADHGGGHCEAVSCPPGKVLARGLRYWNECLEPPPKSCPAGWTPVAGATCSFARCDEATPCATGTACRATPVCTKDGQGFGQNDPSATSRSLFAAPRAPRASREYVGACDANDACASIGQECRSVRVCLPPGIDRVASRPENARSAKAYAAYGGKVEGEPVLGSDTPSVTATGATATAAATVATAAPRTEPVPPQSGRGGAGCGAARTAGAPTRSEHSAAAAALAVVGGLAVARRRRAR